MSCTKTIVLQVCYNFPGMLQLLSGISTISHWNAYNYATTYTGMLLLHLKTNAQKLNYHSLYRHAISTTDCGCGFLSNKLVFRVRLVHIITLIAKCLFYYPNGGYLKAYPQRGDHLM